MVLPKFWSYLLRSFLQRFFGALFLLLVLLITARFQEIASFMALSGSLLMTAKFIAIQLPLLLPFAMTISSVIAAYTLSWSITSSNELIALRLSSLSLLSVFAPIRYALFMIACISALIAAEYAPLSRILSKKAIEDASITNPFSLLQKGFGVTSTNVALSYEKGENSSNIASFRGAFYNEKDDTLELALADSITIEQGEIVAKNLQCIKKEKSSYLIDQSRKTLIAKSSLTDYLTKNKQQFSSSAYPFSYHISSHNVEHILKAASFLFFPTSILSLPLCAIAGGYSYSRSKNRRGRITLLVALALSFFGFAFGRSLTDFPIASLFFYVVPNGIAYMLGRTEIVRSDRGYA